ARFDKSLRRRTVFSDHSLVSDSVFAEVQLVSCRNVLIYFDRPTQEKLVGKFYQHLTPGGYLLIGHSESLQTLQHPFKYREATVYQKPLI
ncbi:MAG: hypothetical protein JNG88_09995, partial [Phycisphaerales bacterium]|nr:hypothetical protein [Phycisphaerales bacterium]